MAKNETAKTSLVPGGDQIIKTVVCSIAGLFAMKFIDLGYDLALAKIQKPTVEI